MRSSLIYAYSCASCAHQYIGSSIRNLYMRVSEHQGKSFRTGIDLSKPNSPIFDHKFECNTKVDISEFKILDHASSIYKLRILESLYIHKEKPKLNDNESAVPLLIVRH